MTIFLLMPKRGNKPLYILYVYKLILLEVYKIVNMLGPKYLHEMFVVHDSAYDIRNSVNIVMPNLILLSMVKTLSLILVQSHGIYFIMKPNKLLI